MDKIYFDPMLKFRENPSIYIKEYTSNFKTKKRKYSHIE